MATHPLKLRTAQTIQPCVAAMHLCVGGVMNKTRQELFSNLKLLKMTREKSHDYVPWFRNKSMFFHPSQASMLVTSPKIAFPKPYLLFSYP